MLPLLCCIEHYATATIKYKVYSTYNVLHKILADGHKPIIEHNSCIINYSFCIVGTCLLLCNGLFYTQPVIKLIVVYMRERIFPRLCHYNFSCPYTIEIFWCTYKSNLAVGFCWLGWLVSSLTGHTSGLLACMCLNHWVICTLKSFFDLSNLHILKLLL